MSAIGHALAVAGSMTVNCWRFSPTCAVNAINWFDATGEGDAER